MYYLGQHETSPVSVDAEIPDTLYSKHFTLIFNSNMSIVVMTIYLFSCIFNIILFIF